MARARDGGIRPRLLSSLPRSNSSGAEQPHATPGPGISQFLCPQRPDTPEEQIARRAMSSAGRSSQIRPHPLLTTTSTTAAIPRLANAAISGGGMCRGSRPSRRSGGAGGRGWGCGPGGGEIGHKFPELTPGPGGQRLPGSFVELRGRAEPARLEMLAEVCQDRVTVGIGRLHCIRKMAASHRVHRVLAFLFRAVVSGVPHTSNVAAGGLSAPLPNATGRR